MVNPLRYTVIWLGTALFVAVGFFSIGYALDYNHVYPLEIIIGECGIANTVILTSAGFFIGTLLGIQRADNQRAYDAIGEGTDREKLKLAEVLDNPDIVLRELEKENGQAER